MEKESNSHTVPKCVKPKLHVTTVPQHLTILRLIICFILYHVLHSLCSSSHSSLRGRTIRESEPRKRNGNGLFNSSASADQDRMSVRFLLHFDLLRKRVCHQKNASELLDHLFQNFLLASSFGK